VEAGARDQVFDSVSLRNTAIMAGPRNRSSASSSSSPTATDGEGAETVGFETALEGLERVVSALETGELGLDEAIVRYEEGVRLLSRCRALLEGAERKVALLTGVDADGKPVTEPFDASATATTSGP
jgi:exodeoxyribonuclease VII small subunit